LAGETTSDPDIVEYMWCQFFHCLPSQLAKEDSKKIEKFIAIKNELEFRKKIDEKTEK
jgi:hypothetical protein